MSEEKKKARSRFVISGQEFLASLKSPEEAEAFVKQRKAEIAARREERAKRGSREKYEAVLAKIPDVEPEEYDRLD